MSPWTHAWLRPSRPNSHFTPTRSFLKSHTTRTDLSTLKSTPFLLTQGFIFFSFILFLLFPLSFKSERETFKERIAHKHMFTGRHLQGQRNHHAFPPSPTSSASSFTDANEHGGKSRDQFCYFCYNHNLLLLALIY